MNKMQMAHDMALELVKIKPSLSAWQIADRCFEYADAMQAEADKRNKAEAEQKRKEIREILNDANTFIEREDKTRPDVLKEEWQPDWSQAPDGATQWSMTDYGTAKWQSTSNKPLRDLGCAFGAENSLEWSAPTFGYQGNWQDSLRKRPQ